MRETINPRRVMHEILRTDFLAFVTWAFSVLYPGKLLKTNWHIVVMAEHFEDVYYGRRRKLLICLPPRHLKTFIGSVCFPAWVLGRDPSAKLVSVSYAQNIAEGFAHQCRMLMDSPQYKQLFPKTRIDPRRSSKRDIGTTRNGHRIATSVTGPLTALGGDFLIIDDPIKADDALSDVVRESVNTWFASTASSRLDDPKSGAIVLIAQRLHVDDLAGRMILAGGWDQIILPLISYEEQVFETRTKRITRLVGDILHEDRMGAEEIANLKNTVPPFLFEAQWNQRPVMASGNIFKLEWLRYVEEPLPLHEFAYIVQSWDTAVKTDEKNDYTVCATFGLRGAEIHLLDIYRDRIDHPDQIKMVAKLRRTWSANLVIVEGSHGGIAINQHFRKNGPAHWIVDHTPRAPKNERAEWQTTKFSQGRVILPRNAPWRASFETELGAFPKAPHDDQVDAVSQLLEVVDSPELKNALYRAMRMS